MANWDRIDETGNVEDRRGLGGGIAFAGGGGLIAILLTLGLNYLGLQVPQSTVEEILAQVQSLQSTQVDQSKQPVEFRGDDSYEIFTKRVLGSSDTMWRSIFTANHQTYKTPRLVLFRGVTQSGCGVASSQVGPHYCPLDETIYLDETFFDELQRRFGGSTGEVAQAYVIAHEVGHHVQNRLGAFDTAVTGTKEGSIALELQADCYAGVWAYSQAKNNIFGQSEVEQALSAAAAVGDDNIQKRTEGMINPETWTHGSSAQRVNAFSAGYHSGDPSSCQNLQ
jgi:predicted metalloprotease